MRSLSSHPKKHAAASKLLLFCGKKKGRVLLMSNTCQVDVWTIDGCLAICTLLLTLPALFAKVAWHRGTGAWVSPGILTQKFQSDLQQSMRAANHAFRSSTEKRIYVLEFDGIYKSCAATALSTNSSICQPRPVLSQQL